MNKKSLSNSFLVFFVTLSFFSSADDIVPIKPLKASPSGTTNEYIPLFKVLPIYPRRAQERGIMGYAVVSFTITETGNVQDPETIKGMCGSYSPSSIGMLLNLVEERQKPDLEEIEMNFRPCSIFNKSAKLAALKLQYSPKIINGETVEQQNITHKFTYILQ
jgi:protein TonB